MRIVLLLAAASIAAAAGAQGDARRNPLDPRVAVPAVEYRSVLEGYQPFAEPELANWRKSNDEVGSAGGHAGHKPGQGAGQATSKPQPGKPESAGGAAEKPGSRPGHGAHK